MLEVLYNKTKELFQCFYCRIFDLPTDPVFIVVSPIKSLVITLVSDSITCYLARQLHNFVVNQRRE